MALCDADGLQSVMPPASGGSFSQETVFAGGVLNISAGAIAHDFGVSSGGSVNILGTVTSDTAVFAGGTETVSSGGVLGGVLSSGTAVSGGTLNVLAGGTAHNIAVSSGGNLNVAGTVTSDVVVSAGGIETVSSGGLITGQVYSGSGDFGTGVQGTVNVLAGGSAAFAGISSGAAINVSAGLGGEPLSAASNHSSPSRPSRSESTPSASAAPRGS